MQRLFPVFRVLMFLAASCLIINDVARLVFPGLQQVLFEHVCDEKEQDENNSISAFSFFEEEVKHSGKYRFHHLSLAESELEIAVAHLIKDEDVRHLAYIPIFSPPPNMA